MTSTDRSPQPKTDSSSPLSAAEALARLRKSGSPLKPGELTAVVQGTSLALIPGEIAERQIGMLEQELGRMQRQMRLVIQARLAPFAGHSLASLAENKDLVASIHKMLDRYGLRVRCPECGHPAILRVSPAGAKKGNSKTGVFVYDHTIEGRRTFHGGGGTIPLLTLVVKADRKRPK